MKLEVGMYVRHKPLLSSKYVKINKIKEIEEKENCLHIWLEDKDLITEKYLIKASYSIIDILEVGDIIRYRIDKVPLETKGYLTGVIDIADEEMLENIKEDKNYHVLQILTKEQFEEMSYKIKE